METNSEPEIWDQVLESSGSTLYWKSGFKCHIKKLGSHQINQNKVLSQQKCQSSVFGWESLSPASWMASQAL